MLMQNVNGNNQIDYVDDNQVYGNQINIGNQGN